MIYLVVHLMICEHTVRSLISVVHDAVRRNVTADDDSDVDCSPVLSVTWSDLRRRSGRNVPGMHGVS